MTPANSEASIYLIYAVLTHAKVSPNGDVRIRYVLSPSKEDRLLGSSETSELPVGQLYLLLTWARRGKISQGNNYAWKIIGLWGVKHWGSAVPRAVKKSHKNCNNSKLKSEYERTES